MSTAHWNHLPLSVGFHHRDFVWFASTFKSDLEDYVGRMGLRDKSFDAVDLDFGTNHLNDAFNMMATKLFRFVYNNGHFGFGKGWFARLDSLYVFNGDGFSLEISSYDKGGFLFGELVGVSHFK